MSKCVLRFLSLFISDFRTISENQNLIIINALIIFVKNPELGKVKTRIARTAGNEKALKIYLELMRHTRETVLQINASRFLFYSQDINLNDDWSNNAFEKHLQASGDLGDRMSTAFKKCLKKHDKVVIIGSDCASIKPEIIRKAFAALDKHPFVVGPTFDGGYYLLGMREFEQSLFSDMEWSTESVYPETIARIEKTGKSYALSEILSDIDHEEDWEKYGWELPE